MIEKYKQVFSTGKDPLKDFILLTNKIFRSLSYENNDDHETVSNLYKELIKLTEEDFKKYGGYLFIFTKIAEEKGEGEYDVWFNWDIAINNGYSWIEMISKRKNTVHNVLDEFGKEKFEVYFPSLFILTLLKIVDSATHEEIAEFIVSNDISAYRNALNIDNSDEDFVSDIVILILKTIGYDLSKYKGECKINSSNFLDIGYNMGYNYLSLAEDFRDSNI